MTAMFSAVSLKIKVLLVGVAKPVYKAVENALWSNDVNKYILDEAFGLNNYLPTKIIITVQGAI